MPSKYTTRYLDKTEYIVWDSFVDECEDGSIFNKSFWLENIYKYQKNITFRIVGCFDKNKELIAGVAIGVKNKFFLIPIIVPPILTPYNSILIKTRETKYISKKENSQFLIIEKINTFLNKNLKFITLQFPPSFKDIRSFLWNGFSEEIKYTYTEKITDIDKLYEYFDPSLKRQIKKGLKHNYKLNFDFNDNEIKTSYMLLQSMHKNNQKKGFLNFKDFDSFIKILNANNSLLLCNIYKDKIPVYTNIILMDKSTAFYWLAGGNYNLYNTGLNQVLLYNILDKLNQLNCKFFDFVGANTDSIAKYKSNYNFKLTPYYAVKKINGIIPKILFKIKEIIND
ncbi:MAG TPA: GNAT family N-acetyltransferase [Halanaerobiales bacterium]|nr:GNAT family N-acetyltransferase [Halanaerobiales bacterium]